MTPGEYPDENDFFTDGTTIFTDTMGLEEDSAWITVTASNDWVTTL